MRGDPHREPVVTGLGIVAPIGGGVEEFWAALLWGRSGVGEVRAFDPAPFPARIGCEVREFLPAPAPAGHQPIGRTAQLAAAAGSQALAAAGLAGAERAQTGLCVGTTMGEACWIEHWPPSSLIRGPGFAPVEELLRSGPDQVAVDTAALLGLEGPVLALGGACAAGSYAIGHAADEIRLGRTQRVLAGGAEAFSRVAYTGFGRLGALASSACRPFSADRDGIVLGEGAAMLLVESAASAGARGATVLARIAGFGLSADAHHIVSPAPGGEGAARAMLAALADAGLSADDVDYLSAHGTGTPANDAAEVAAARLVFGARGVPMSSIKALTGHALGASSAFEAVASVQTLLTGVIPPTWNYRRPDPECDWDVVPNEPRSARCRRGPEQRVRLRRQQHLGRVHPRSGVTAPSAVLGWGAISPGGVGDEALRPPASPPAGARVIEGFDVSEHLQMRGLRPLSRASRLACVAAAAALDYPRALELDPSRCAVVVGSRWGHIDPLFEFEQTAAADGPALVNPSHFPNVVANVHAGYLAILFGLSGPNVTLCGPGAGMEAIGLGLDLLDLGRADAVLAGGVEALGPALLEAETRSGGEPAPGEGAAFVLLGSPGGGREPVAEVVAFETGSNGPELLESRARGGRGRARGARRVRDRAGAAARP